MNENVNRRIEMLLGGDFAQFSKSEQVVEKQIDEDVSLEIPDIVEEEKTFIEKLFESLNVFDNTELNESDSDIISKLDISDEMYAIQEALDSIKEKVLDESVTDIITSSPALLPIIAGGIAAAIGWVFKRKVAGDSAIPRPVVNTLYAINQYVKSGDEDEKTNAIKRIVRKSHPNLDDKQIDNIIRIAKKNDEKLSAMRSSKPKRILHGGQKSDYVTDFAKMNRKRFNLE